MRSRRFIFPIALASSLFPLLAVAAPAPASAFLSAQSLVSASSTPGNAYTAGANVTVTAPTGGDLSIIGGTITLPAPVSRDALLLGGSISTRAPFFGDLRALGGSVRVDEAVGGDLVAIGFSVHDATPAKGSTFITAVDAAMTDGAEGPVIIYGNNVALAGHFTGDVNIVSSGSVTLAPGTIIDGRLTYTAPEKAHIPASAVLGGGSTYTNASYLPAGGASHALAVASLGIFLLARILGALILAGLLAGLFPELAEAVAARAWSSSGRTVLLTMLLGFAAIVATPILLILLALTFVGLGIALLLGIGYALLVVLAGVYAGILVGSLIARRFEQRERARWRDGALGMLVLSLIALLPYLGMLVFVLLMTFSAGTLLLLFFRSAFPHEDSES